MLSNELIDQIFLEIIVSYSSLSQAYQHKEVYKMFKVMAKCRDKKIKWKANTRFPKSDCDIWIAKTSQILYLSFYPHPLQCDFAAFFH
jgi:hypothetical protein